MNLRDIGRAVADEMVVNEKVTIPGMERMENEDGTVTLSIPFSLDQEYATEMARAMPKGETREDQIDKVEGGERDETDTETNSEDDSELLFSPVEDEAVECSTEDDARHSETPIENCRAKDPMFCPYHGTQVMTKKLQDMFNQHGINGQVSVEGKGYHFTAKVTVPAQDEQTAIADIYNGFLKQKGVEIVRKGEDGDDATKNDGYESSYEAEIKVSEGNRLEPRQLMSEWADNIVEKLADNPDLKKEVSRNDFVNMLGAVAEMHKAADAASADTTGDQNLDAAAQSAYDKASKAIDTISAMIDFKDVKTIDDAKKKSDIYDDTVAKAKSTYAPLDQQIRAKKVKLFGQRGAYPQGFTQDNQWAAEKVASKLSDFSHTGKTLAEAESGIRAAYGALANAGKKNTDSLSYSERKNLRVALQNMGRASEMVEGHAAHNAERANVVIGKLDELIAKNPNGYVKTSKSATKRTTEGV